MLKNFRLTKNIKLNLLPQKVKLKIKYFLNSLFEIKMIFLILSKLLIKKLISYKILGH